MSVKTAIEKCNQYRSEFLESDIEYKEFGAFMIDQILDAINKTDFSNTHQVLYLNVALEEIRRKNYDEEFFIIPALDMHIKTIQYELFDKED